MDIQGLFAEFLAVHDKCADWKRETKREKLQTIYCLKDIGLASYQG